MCGLIMQREQFDRYGWDLRFYDEKMYPSSLWADWAESLPWQAFLVPSVPKLALIL